VRIHGIILTAITLDQLVHDAQEILQLSQRSKAIGACIGLHPCCASLDELIVIEALIEEYAGQIIGFFLLFVRKV
jgi:Tat protein secretion system quality control protein TatD with DNase activity